MVCRVNESPYESKNDAKDRLEMKRKVRLLEASINEWNKGGDLEKGILPAVSEGFERSSSKFSLHDPSLGGDDGENAEFVRLKKDLQNRLSRSGGSVPDNRYFE